MRREFVETLSTILDEDDRVVLMLGDIGVFGFRRAAERHPQRVINIGIMEQTMVGVGAGLALGGHIPVLHTIAPFVVERALEQIKIDFGYQRLPGNIVTVGASYDYSALGATHHCPGDAGVLLNVPEIEIFVPGSAREWSQLFSERYGNERLSYFRLSEHPNEMAHEVRAGVANLIKRGSKGLVIAVGPMLDTVLSATENLDVSIVYVTSLRPFDGEIVANEATSGRIVIVEPFYEGTVAPLVLEAVEGMATRIKSIGVPRNFIHSYGSFEEQTSRVGLSVESVASSIRTFL